VNDKVSKLSQPVAHEQGDQTIKWKRYRNCLNQWPMNRETKQYEEAMGVGPIMCTEPVMMHPSHGVFRANFVTDLLLDSFVSFDNGLTGSAGVKTGIVKLRISEARVETYRECRSEDRYCKT
jgi:hypothetical protein